MKCKNCGEKIKRREPKCSNCGKEIDHAHWSVIVYGIIMLITVIVQSLTNYAGVKLLGIAGAADSTPDFGGNSKFAEAWVDMYLVVLFIQSGGFIVSLIFEFITFFLFQTKSGAR